MEEDELMLPTATITNRTELMLDTPLDDVMHIALWARGRNRIEGHNEFVGEVIVNGASLMHPAVQALLAALVAPTNNRQRLAVAVLLGDDVAALALVDAVKEELER